MEEDNFDVTFRCGWNACRAANLQGSQPVNNRDELPPQQQVERWLNPQQSTEVILYGRSVKGFIQKWRNQYFSDMDYELLF